MVKRGPRRASAASDHRPAAPEQVTGQWVAGHRAASHWRSSWGRPSGDRFRSHGSPPMGGSAYRGSGLPAARSVHLSGVAGQESLFRIDLSACSAAEPTRTPIGSRSRLTERRTAYSPAVQLAPALRKSAKRRGPVRYSRTSARCPGFCRVAIWRVACCRSRIRAVWDAPPAVGLAAIIATDAVRQPVEDVPVLLRSRSVLSEQRG